METVKTRRRVVKNTKERMRVKFQDSVAADANALADKVQKKAYELYEKRGRRDGHDLDDWYEALSLVQQESMAGSHAQE